MFNAIYRRLTFMKLIGYIDTRAGIITMYVNPFGWRTWSTLTDKDGRRRLSNEYYKTLSELQFWSIGGPFPDGTKIIEEDTTIQFLRNTVSKKLKGEEK